MPLLPHFELITAPAREQHVGEVFDFSLLNAGDGDLQIDSGVTSGADSTSWDEISVDRDGRVDTCADAAATKAGDKGAPAVCKDAGAASDRKP